MLCTWPSESLQGGSSGSRAGALDDFVYMRLCVCMLEKQALLCPLGKVQGILGRGPCLAEAFGTQGLCSQPWRGHGWGLCSPPGCLPVVKTEVPRARAL